VTRTSSRADQRQRLLLQASRDITWLPWRTNIFCRASSDNSGITLVGPAVHLWCIGWTCGTSTVLIVDHHVFLWNWLFE
jgi:hypothetical protein